VDFWTRSQVRNYTRDNLWVVIIDPLCTLKISHSPYMYPAVSWSWWHPHSATLFVALYFWWSLVIPQNNYYLLWKTTTCRLWPQIFFEVIHVVDVSGFINCHHIGIDIWEGGSDCNFSDNIAEGGTIHYTVYDNYYCNFAAFMSKWCWNWQWSSFTHISMPLQHQEEDSNK